MSFQNDPEKKKDLDGMAPTFAESLEESGVTADGTFDPDYSEPTAKELKRLMLKIDLRVVPYASFLYLLSYLDRVNIGNAKIAGMMEDISMPEADYNWALSIFFIGYIIFQVPANLMLKWMGPRLWISVIMVIWGTIMCSMSACTSGSGLLAARFFLGIAESGLYPGILYYLSVWYTRKQVAIRVALFYSSNTLAGAFGGLLAYGIMHMKGLRDLNGWQWIFIIEAIPTLLFGFLTFLILPDYPDKAKFLTERERSIILTNKKRDTAVAPDTHFSWKQVVSVIFDWKTWVFSIVYICSATPPYALSMFMPSIVNGMGYTNVYAQLMTVPVWACAFVWCVGNSYHAGKTFERGAHMAVSAALCMVGYILLIALKDQPSNYLYAGAVISTTGAFGIVPILISWFSNNYGSETRRNVGIAAITSIGNLSGVISGQVYRQTDAPKYVVGHSICLALMGVTLMSSLALKAVFYFINKKRANMSIEEIQAAVTGKKELGER
ncbi:hypothetical protein INT45_011688, partial [Circinella minor]